MSALGQKQTLPRKNVMSALLRIATAKADFRKRPSLFCPIKADMCSARCPLRANSEHLRREKSYPPRKPTLRVDLDRRQRP